MSRTANCHDNAVTESFASLASKGNVEIEMHRQDLQARIQGVKKRLHTHIEQHETFKEYCALVISLPGIAELSAARLLAEIVKIKRSKTVKQLVAHAGLAPQEQSSVTSVHSKAGRSKLRTSLYMCAVFASTHDPAIRAYAQHLRQRGKLATAVMCKLLHMAYGILKAVEVYDPSKAFLKTAVKAVA